MEPQTSNTHNATDVCDAHAFTFQMNETQRYSPNLGEAYFENFMTDKPIDFIEAPYFSGSDNFTTNPATAENETIDALPESPIVDDVFTLGFNHSYIDPINGIRSPDAVNGCIVGDATMYSPNETKPTATHFDFPETEDMDLCGSPDFNQDIGLQDMLRTYTCDVPISQSCVDVSFLNLMATSLPMTP